MNKESFNVSAWLKEGFILQVDSETFILGEGPFDPSSRPTKGFYYRNFFLNEASPSWFVPQKIKYFNREEIEVLLNDKTKETFSFSESETEKPSFIEFQEIFYQIKNQIKQKKFSKIVPVFFEKLSKNVQIKYYLKKLFQNTTSNKLQGFIYGCWQNQKGILGFTPEILFSVKKKQFKTMALAGTSSAMGPSLFTDDKEIKEQQFVIQDIQESLSHLVKWKKKVSYEKYFFNLKHICTELEGEITGVSDVSLFCDKLHPTAAMGGYSKKEACSWLREHPFQKRRGSLGAPFGFFNGKNQFFCVVAIRGIQWDRDQISIGSGCGLISESVLQKEWRELHLKREQIKNLFK